MMTLNGDTILSLVTDQDRLDIILAGTGFSHKTRACWHYWKHGEDFALWQAISRAVAASNKANRPPVAWAYPETFTLYMVNHSMSGGVSPSGYNMDLKFYNMACTEGQFGQVYRKELLGKYSRTKAKTFQRWQRALDILKADRNLQEQEKSHENGLIRGFSV